MYSPQIMALKIALLQMVPPQVAQPQMVPA